MHVSGKLTGLIGPSFELCPDVRELDGSYHDCPGPVSAATTTTRGRGYLHDSYREQGDDAEALDRVVHAPEHDAGQGDEGAVGEDVEGANGVVQDRLETHEPLQRFSRAKPKLTWSTHFPLLAHGLGSAHWNARARMDANDHASTMASRMRLHSTVRLSDIILWRR